MASNPYLPYTHVWALGYTHTHTCTRAHACNTTNFIRFYVYPKLHHMLPYTHTHTNTGSASRPSGCAENSPLRGRASTRSLKLKIDFRCNTNDTHTHTHTYSLALAHTCGGEGKGAGGKGCPTQNTCDAAPFPPRGWVAVLAVHTAHTRHRGSDARRNVDNDAWATAPPTPKLLPDKPNSTRPCVRPAVNAAV